MLRADQPRRMACPNLGRDAAVIDIILNTLEAPGIVPALAAGDPIPQVFVVELEGRVGPEERHQSIPALAMVELVIGDIRRAFGPQGSNFDLWWEEAEKQ